MQQDEKVTLGMRLVTPSDREPDGTLVLALMNAVHERTDPDTHTVNMNFEAAKEMFAKLRDLMVTWNMLRQQQEQRERARRSAEMN